MKNIINFLIVLMFTLNIEHATPGQLIIPQELFEIAEGEGYTQINNFFNRPGMVEPPFIYGYEPGPKENSAVFWCKSKEMNHYYLIVVKTDSDSWSKIITDIIPWSNFPGGLSIYYNKDTLLDDFVFIRDTSKKVPKGEKLTHNGILSYYDGVETVFYRYKDEWIVRIRH